MSNQMHDPEQLHAYMIPVTSKNKKVGVMKNTHPIVHSKNHSLPSISFAKQQKANVLRNQVDEANHEILLLRARLNTLKIQKERADKKKQRNRDQISFIQTVRDRMFQDKQQKQKNNEKKERQLNKIRNQANQLREQLIKNRELSKSIIKEKKFEEAEEERQRKRDDEEFLKKLRSIEKSQNQLRAKNIRREEYEIEEKLREFKQSRISFAISNHREKVGKSMSEKQKAKKTLEKLRRKQRRLIEDFKQSQADMMNSIYQLQSLNPEKKRKFTSNSTKTSNKQNS